MMACLTDAEDRPAFAEANARRIALCLHRYMYWPSTLELVCIDCPHVIASIKIVGLRAQ